MIFVSPHLTPVKYVQSPITFQSAAAVLDLKDAKNLTEVEFRFHGRDVDMIVETLHTIDSEKLNKVSIHLPFTVNEFRSLLRDELELRSLCEKWEGLDSVLSQLSEWSDTMHVKIVWCGIGSEPAWKFVGIECFLGCLLPVLMWKMGMEERERRVNPKISIEIRKDYAIMI